MKSISHILQEVFKNNKLFIISAVLVYGLILIVALLNGRFRGVDFQVYYYAAEAFINGNQVYDIAFGYSEVGYYKYSPFVLMLYIPAALLPIQLATILNYIFMALVAICTVFVSCKIAISIFDENDQKLKNGFLFIIFLLSLTFFNRDILLGNVNGLMLLLICLGYIFANSDNKLLAGLFFAVAIAFKPYFLIILLPLLGNHKTKTFFITSGILIIISFIPVVFLGWHSSIEFYKSWFTVMIEHNSYIISPFTIDSLLKKYFFIGSEINFTYYILASIIVMYVIFKVAIALKSKNSFFNTKPDQLFFIETFTFLALIPNIVNTDTQQLMFAMPLVAFLVYYLIINRNRYLLAVLIILFFFYAVDQPGILGRPLSKLFYDYGIAGIANLLIIAFSWAIIVFENKKKANLDTKDPINPSL